MDLILVNWTSMLFKICLQLSVGICEGLRFYLWQQMVLISWPTVFKGQLHVSRTPIILFLSYLAWSATVAASYPAPYVWLFEGSFQGAPHLTYLILTDSFQYLARYGLYMPICVNTRWYSLGGAKIWLVRNREKFPNMWETINYRWLHPLNGGSFPLLSSNSWIRRRIL